MDNIPPRSSFGLADGSVAEKERAMQLGVSFNGVQFVFREFKYDKLADALAYAELDAARGDCAVPSRPEEWLERPVPGQADQEIMAQFGIGFEGWRYRFGEYRYDRLADALNYARSQGERR